jgi:hypothetical protein
VAFSSSNLVSFKATIPCVGLSSSVQMSDQTDTRVVDMLVEKTSTQSVTADVTNITYSSTVKDTHGMWSSDTATIAVAGDYLFTTGISVSSSSSSLKIYKNGSLLYTLSDISTTKNIYSKMLPNLKVRDTITIRIASSLTINGDSTGAHFLQLVRIAGPNQIAASETIAATYYCSTNQSATTSAPINFDTKATNEGDSHSSVTTGAGWRFTSKSARLYSVDVYAGPTTSVSGTLNIYKSGSLYKSICSYVSGSYASGSTKVKLLADEYIEIRPSASHSFTGGSATAQGTAYISITSVGL